jgi:anti-sigma B factor antagonist
MSENAAPFAITTTADGWIIAGEIDASTAPSLADALSSFPGPTCVLDVAGVTFMDSSALRVLIEATRRARAAGGDLVVKNVNGSLTRLVAITGLGDHLTIR